MVTAFRDPSRFRLAIALGAAFLLHAGGALVGYRVAREAGWSAGVTPELAQAAETEIDIIDAISGEGADLTERADRTDDRTDPSGASAMAIAAVERSRDQKRAPLGVAPMERASGAPGTEQGQAEGYSLDPSSGIASGAPTTAGSIQLGIGEGDWSRWVDPAAAPSRGPAGPREIQPPPVSSTGGLAEALEARDQALGLGPAGAVLTAVHEAGYSEVAPALGAATFSITVLRSGAVDVRLTGASSQSAAWAKVGESIAAAIRRKPPHIAPTRIGVRLGIEVVAEERWPNGQPTRSSHGPKIAGTGPKFEATETARQRLLERNPAAVPEPDEPSDKPPIQANVETPGVFVEGRGKVCSYKIGVSLTPISGACDPTNIGQPARRVVSTRVISQTML